MKSRVNTLYRKLVGASYTVNVVRQDGAYTVSIVTRRGKAVHDGPMESADLLAFLLKEAADVLYIDGDSATFWPRCQAQLIGWIQNPASFDPPEPPPLRKVDLTPPRYEARRTDLAPVTQKAIAAVAERQAVGFPCEACGKSESRTVHVAGKDWHLCLQCLAKRSMYLMTLDDDLHDRGLPEEEGRLLR